MDKEDVISTYDIHIYYSAMKKNEILPFAMIQIELKYIMLSKISQRKTNTI